MTSTYKFSNKMKSLSTLAVIIVFIFSSCGDKAKSKEETKAASTTITVKLSKKQLDVLNIKLGTFTEQPVSKVIEANGKVVILPQFQASITAKVNGTIDKILVHEGAFVKQSEAMFIISSFELIQIQQEYLNAKSQFTFAKADLERQQKMTDEKFGAAKEFQSATAKFQQYQTEMNVAKAKLQLLNINPETEGIKNSLTVSAPLSGYIVKLPVSIGTQTTPQTVLAQVYNMEHPHADIFVYPKDINFISEGTKVEVDFIGQNLGSVTGTIERINREVDPELKAIILHTDLAAIKGMWIPETQVRAKIFTAETTQPTIPLSALLLEEDNNFIYYTTDANAETISFTKIPVTVTYRNNTIAVITTEKPLPANAMIVTEGVMFVNGETTKNEE